MVSLMASERKKYLSKSSENRMKILLLVSAAIIVQGCSYQNWYTGIKESQRQKCYANPNSVEVQECLERNGMDYERYKQEREKRLSGADK